MSDPRKLGVLWTALAALAVVVSSTVSADPLRPLSAEAQKPWHAVGKLQGPGFRMERGCSGTLIAPDLVVTAAHCLTGALWKSEKQEFKAGLFKGSYVARRTYEQVDIHPLYATKTGTARLPYDIAVVKLTDPIAHTEITPVPLLSSRAPPHWWATLLGYRHDRPKVLSGQSDCKMLPPPHPLMFLYDCEVVSGTSGGAVIVETEDGPALAAVIVARHGRDGEALAVPISTWLREKLLQAQRAAVE